jgi:hypothetical protein
MVRTAAAAVYKIYRSYYRVAAIIAAATGAFIYHIVGISPILTFPGSRAVVRDGVIGRVFPIPYIIAGHFK